jgi:hypothetical protein
MQRHGSRCLTTVCRATRKAATLPDVPEGQGRAPCGQLLNREIRPTRTSDLVPFAKSQLIATNRRLEPRPAREPARMFAPSVAEITPSAARSGLIGGRPPERQQTEKTDARLPSAAHEDDPSRQLRPVPATEPVRSLRVDFALRAA